MMIILIKMITSDFKVLTYIITSIPACSYWTCYNTTDNVCVDFHNCRYFVYTAELVKSDTRVCDQGDQWKYEQVEIDATTVNDPVVSFFF
jgi:hypothetical protein